MARNKIVAVRLDADLKDEVGEIFLDLGLTTSQATVLFYKQVLLHKGLPFELRLPSDPVRQSLADAAAGERGEHADRVIPEPLFADMG